MDETQGPIEDAAHSRVFRLAELTIDSIAGEIHGPAGGAQLDPKVMDVLVALVRRAGKVVLREDLLREVWNGTVVTDDALSRCIYQLRRQLAEAGGPAYRSLLETLPKRGYRLNCPATEPGDTRSPAGSEDPGRAIASRPDGVTRAFPRWMPAALAAVLAAVLAIAGVSAVLLHSHGYFWRNPLDAAVYSRLTDFEGSEQAAVISRSGRLVAFLWNRAGVWDAWLKDLETGAFRNLTAGQGGELWNADVRTIEFSPDDSHVMLWRRTTDESGSSGIDIWAVPVGGGPLRLYLHDAAEIGWSSDGARRAYHPAAPGDPLFVTGTGETVGRQVFTGPAGTHSHFPVWSPDDAFIYFVHGLVPDDLDVWRIAAVGGEAERITFHRSRVSHPVFLDRRTLAYLATEEDGAGPWLYVVDVERRKPHRVSHGVESYTSLSATANGRRLVASVRTQRTSLWGVSLSDRVTGPADATPIELPTFGGSSPRFGRGYLLYLSPDDATRGLWRLDNGEAIELWDGRQGRVVSQPAVHPNGDRIAFTVALEGRRQLYVSDDEGKAARPLAKELDVRGNPAWFPDGRSLAVGADRGGGVQLFRIPAEGGRSSPLIDKYSIDPVWSPDSSFFVYRGSESGPNFPLFAANADGTPRNIPEIVLPRGAHSFAFLPDGKTLVILKGELRSKNFWVVNLETGAQRQLTDFESEFVIGDFDVSVDGQEIVFDRIREDSDVVEIEPANR
jgi:Tol biopolymer transport system component/DNA-binding winged helix-turn-helix (wHTH) protein